VKMYRGAFIAALLLSLAALGLAADVVVLKGGSVIELAKPWVRRGSVAYLTRADGTLLSVPVGEIDRDATAVESSKRAAAAAAPSKTQPAASTPADVARVTKEGPRAKVRITDADVSHPLEDVSPAASDEKKDQRPGGPRVEIADYTQEKNGATLVVRGKMRNVGQATAESLRMAVTAIDEKGQSIDGTNVSLSKGSLEAGQTVDFTGTMNVGDKTVASLRFAPLWTVPPPPPAPTPRPGTAAAALAAAAAKPPAPQPTPYGLGNVFAAPPASAPSEAPADGKTGYIPNASHPDNQPHPPTP
jgi:hypothetical protein